MFKKIVARLVVVALLFVPAVIAVADPCDKEVITTACPQPATITVCASYGSGNCTNHVDQVRANGPFDCDSADDSTGCITGLSPDDETECYTEWPCILQGTNCVRNANFPTIHYATAKVGRDDC